MPYKCKSAFLPKKSQNANILSCTSFKFGYCAPAKFQIGSLNYDSNIWLGNHALLQPPPVAQHSKGSAVVTHLDAVTITVIIALALTCMVSLTSVLFKGCLHTRQYGVPLPLLIYSLLVKVS